jgi:hypothetical protein
MPLETGDYISDLVETNPPGTDPVSQGDDHLRLIKHVLKMTFPNVSGPVTSTDEELSNLGQQMPIITVYDSAASAQTHTFTPGRNWYKVIVTGGGGSGGDLIGGPNVSGGSAGGTAIKTAAITAASATYTVGQGAAAFGDGGDSSFDDGTETVVGGGGKQGVELYGGSLDGGIATGGDINLIGGSYTGGTGGTSYWGGSNSSLSPNATYGCGGKAENDSGGAGPIIPAGPGISGIIVIEEYV